MSKTDTLLRAENLRLRGALQQIAAIENEMVGGDWDEIDHARTVALDALNTPPVTFDQVPTKFIDRFQEVLTLLAGGKAPSLEHCDMWLRNIQAGAVDPLQEWAANNVVLPWAQGIGAIDAARTLAEQPEEGVEHESFEEAYPSEVEVTELDAEAQAAETDDEWLARMHVAIKQFHTHDFGSGPQLHADCISDALRKGLARSAERASNAEGADGAAGADSLEQNVRYLLERCPFTVRDLSGELTGVRGIESLTGSLAITFLAMQSRLTGAAQQQAATTGRGLSVDLPERVADVVAQTAGISGVFTPQFYRFAQDLKDEVLARVPSSALATGGQSQAAQTLHEFKNFHRNLCMRFDYVHDERDWKRDQASLEEHIAARFTRSPA